MPPAPQPWRLLLLSCSARKRQAGVALPALERYDGPAFRLLRRFRRTVAVDAGVPVRAYVLSAEFGLVAEDTLLPWYDRRLTPARSRELRPHVVTALRALTAAGPPRAALVCAAGRYLEALADAPTLFGGHVPLAVTSGPPGRRMAHLHDWLHGEPPPPPPAGVRAHPGVPPRLRGAPALCVGSELLAAARAAFAAAGPGQAPAGATRYHAWYVDLDGHRVAPKWLATLATGRGVGTFSTDDARRLLAQLGIPVQRGGPPGAPADTPSVPPPRTDTP